MKAHGKLMEHLSKDSMNMFCKMFPLATEFRPKIKALKRISKLMIDEDGGQNSEVAAGYTYLGQFIDHDITADSRGGLSQDELERAPNLSIEDLEQLRTPSLDLDSLYGEGPFSSVSNRLYDMKDLIKFKIGLTSKVTRLPEIDKRYPNDLPREGESNMEAPAKAILGDGRNDENLVLSQTHLAFLKFHNNVVDLLRKEHKDKSDEEIFKLAKRIVTEHYQSIVLHDFLPQFADPDIYKKVVLEDNPSFFEVVLGENPCMPIEFSGAAFRLHTLIRDAYDWNRFFNRNEDQTGTLRLLFFFTGRSNFSGGRNNLMVGNKPTLPSDWIIDWRRFYDFGGAVVQPEGFVNRTKHMDTKIAKTLHNLPGMEGNLADKNLIRGLKIGLPHAQDLLNITGLPALDIRHNDIHLWGFNRKTPLWYYLMIEAEEMGVGNSKMGPLGSTIICETLLGLVKGSRISIFEQADWKPTLPSKDPNKFTMVDLLLFNNDLFPVDEVLV